MDRSRRRHAATLSPVRARWSRLGQALEGFLSCGKDAELHSVRQARHSEQTLDVGEWPRDPEPATSEPIRDVVKQRKDRPVYEPDRPEVEKDRIARLEARVDICLQFTDIASVEFTRRRKNARTVADLERNRRGILQVALRPFQPTTSTTLTIL
jgi:hypothetical protein